MQIKWKRGLQLLLVSGILIGACVLQTGMVVHAQTDDNFSTLEDKPKRAILLMVSSASYQSAGINWLSQPDAEGYYIYRSESSDESTYTKVAEITDPLVSYYEDTGLTIGTKYYYRICAYKIVNGQKVSGELSLSINSDITLSQPDKVKAKSMSYDEIRLTWAAVDDAYGYIIYQSKIEDKGYKEITRIKGQDTCEFKQTGLVTGETYYYRVEAYLEKDGKVLVSPRSDITSVIPSIPAVQNMTVTSDTYNSADLRWDSQKGAQGYVIYRSTHEDKDYEEIDIISGHDTTSYKDTKLNTGTTYYYKIKAYRKVKGTIAKGFACNAVSVTPILEVPVINTESSTTVDMITLNWDAVDGASGYQIYRSASETGEFEKIDMVSKKVTSYEDTIVDPGTQYYYKVQAYRTVHNKKVESEQSEAMLLETLPDQVIITDISNQNEVDIVVKFDTVKGADGYLLERSNKKDTGFKEVTKITETASNTEVSDTEETDETDTGNIDTEDTDESEAEDTEIVLPEFESQTISYTDEGLTDGTTYYYRVTAYQLVDGKEVYGESSETVNQKTKKIEKDTEGNKIKYGSGLSATEADIKLMTALCEREAGTNYANCLAVANVVINRVKSSNYPSSIRGVIYQSGQFEGVNNGILNRYLPNPKRTCRKAVTDALAGKNNIGTRKSFRASWYYRSRGMHRSGAITIGDNTFFSEG